MKLSFKNGGKMISAIECKLELPQLPERSREGHILAGLPHSQLISIDKVCDAGYKSVFTYTNNHIIKYEGGGEGTRDKTTGLWRASLEKINNNTQIGNTQNIRSKAHNT